MGISRHLAAGTVVSARSDNSRLYLQAENAEKPRKKVLMTHQPLKYIQPRVVLWSTNASELFSQGWKSSHQLPKSPSASQTAPLAPDSNLFLQAHVTAVSVTITQGDRICCVSSGTFSIHYLHRLASNILISLNYYSLIQTSCTQQLYFLVFWQQHLKFTFLKVAHKLPVNKYIPLKLGFVQRGEIIPSCTCKH